MVSDSVRLKKLNDLAQNNTVGDAQLRQLMCNRSDCDDEVILGHPEPGAAV
jgi:hypothetical protein